MKYIVILLTTMLMSCHSGIDQGIDSLVPSTELESRSSYPPTSNSPTPECDEYSKWSALDWDVNFTGLSCSQQITLMTSLGENLTQEYSDQITGYCGENLNCSRPTEYIPGQITVGFDSNGNFDGDAVWDEILSAANLLWLNWQAGHGVDSDGRVPFICGRAEIISISLSCNNTPGAPQVITFELFLDGQVSYHCEPCEVSDGPGPIIDIIGY